MKSLKIFTIFILDPCYFFCNRGTKKAVLDNSKVEVQIIMNTTHDGI